MNVAFSALVLLALVLPGFIFLQSFRKTEGERFSLDASPFSRTTVSALTVAALLHGAAVGLLHVFTTYTLNVSDLLALLIGTDSGGLKDAYHHLAVEWSPVVGYFLALILAAWLLGWFVRWIVTRCKLDRSGRRFTRFFRFDTPWYYLFKGYDEELEPAAVYVACTVEVGGGCILYNGVLVDFFLRHDGSLDRIVLAEVQRRPLAKDKEKTIDIPENRFYAIDGDYFVVKYQDVTSLNVRYIWETGFTS